MLTSPLLLEASCFFCLWPPFVAAAEEALGALKLFMFFAFCGFIARWNSILPVPEYMNNATNVKRRQSDPWNNATQTQCRHAPSERRLALGSGQLPLHRLPLVLQLTNGWTVK